MSNDGSGAGTADVLEFGPNQGPKAPSGRLLLVLGLVLVLALGGFAAWHFWPRPPAPLTAEELQGVYAGMVRSDGQNDAQQIKPSNEPPLPVRPTACGPLVQLTQQGLAPGAVDGMTTYWLAEAGSTSLTTHRFVDAAAADAAYLSYQEALGVCDDQIIELPQNEGNDRVRAQKVDIAPVDGAPQVGMLVITVPEDKGTDAQTFTLRLIEFNNTVSVIFHYDPTGRRDATTVREDQLAASLIAQMTSVQDLRTA